MTRVLHLIDASCDETQLQRLATLRARLTAEGQSHHICSIDPEILSRATLFLGKDIWSAPRRVWRILNYVPDLSKVAGQTGAILVHAWGVEAAAAASARLSHLPLALTLLSPLATRKVADWVRAMPRKAVIATGSQVIRARLLSAGIAGDQVVVIRGPADFSAVNKTRQSDLRSTLVGDARAVLLLDGPPSRAGGQYYGLWAAAVVSKVVAGIRVIMPYDSREGRRLQRFFHQIGMADLLVVPDPALTWPQLAACADVFCCPAVEDICTEPIAAAMAAGTPIVGSAVRSIAEIIADRHNGLLCKPREPRALAGKLVTALEDGDLRRRLSEVARGQAYEVFGVRAFLDHYSRLYENLLAGGPAADGISDTAMVA